jgi:medium-chain acyl-[acyl-carrier-protein] hydrolase
VQPNPGIPQFGPAEARVHVIAKRRNPRLRLIVLPYAGGGPQMARGWGASLPIDVEVIAAQFARPGGSSDQSALPTVTELAEGISLSLRDVLLEPYVLYGHSLGALVAFELARRRAWQGDPAPRHLFAAAHRAPQLPRTSAAVSALPDEQMLAELARLNGTPPEVLAAPELIGALLPAIRADLRAAETYRYRPGPRLTCPITAIGGSDDREVSVAELDAWRHQTDAEFRRIELTGDHFFVDKRPSELMAVLRDELVRLG